MNPSKSGGKDPRKHEAVEIRFSLFEEKGPLTDPIDYGTRLAHLRSFHLASARFTACRSKASGSKPSPTHSLRSSCSG